MCIWGGGESGQLNTLYVPSLLTAATEETDGKDDGGDAERLEQKVEDEPEGGVANKEPGDKIEAAESNLNKEGDTKQDTKFSKEGENSESADAQGGVNSQRATERRSSYELATEEDITNHDEEEEVPAIKVEETASHPLTSNEIIEDTRQRKKAGGKRIARSTSSPSAGARIRLQESMGLRSVPGIGAAHSPLLLRSSISTSRGVLTSSLPSPGQEAVSEEKAGTSRMAKLLESEAQTGNYSCPLVGCIPASALKYFAEKEERKQLSTSPQSSASPSLVYEQSGMMYTTMLYIHDCVDCLLSNNY